MHTFVEDVDLSLEADPVKVEVADVDDGYAVTVTASSLARDIVLLADRVAADAIVDDALITLTAGQSTTLHVRTRARNVGQALTGPPVLRTANDLQHT